jgi:hypothetical protein
MVAENILVIVEQLSLEEQIRLYKMIGEKVKPKTRRRKSTSRYDVTDEEAVISNQNIDSTKSSFSLKSRILILSYFLSFIIINYQ